MGAASYGWAAGQCEATDRLELPEEKCRSKQVGAHVSERITMIWAVQVRDVHLELALPVINGADKSTLGFLV